MKRHYLFAALIILSVLLVGTANATLINASVISNIQISTLIGEPFASPSYSFEALSPHVIQELKLATYSDDIPTILDLRFYDGTQVRCTFTTSKPTLFTRLTVAEIAGGTSRSETTLAPFYINHRIFYAQTSNVTPTVYYLVITNLDRFVEVHTAYFDLDTNRDAYLVIQRPSINPVTSIGIATIGTGRFDGYLYYAEMQDIKDSEEHPGTAARTEANIFDLFFNIVSWIEIAYKSIEAVVLLTVGFAAALLATARIVFRPATLGSIIGAYFAVTMVLALGESNGNIFKAINRFVKYQEALGKFFMRIFKWLKDLVKWW